MFKLCSMILIFSSCTLFGFYKAAEYKQRKLLLIEFQDFMLKFFNEIKYFREPLPVILQRMITEDNSMINIMLRELYLNYQKQQRSFSDLWKDAVYHTYENVPLKSDDLLIFSKCGHFLGQTDFDSQKGHFELFQRQIEAQINEAEKTLKTKGSLYGKAGISVGAVLAIALI